MSDESIVNLSQHTKSVMRNYAMVAGFMALFINFTIYAATNLTMTFLTATSVRYCTIAAVLIFCGVILALLHKRDQVSILFITFAMSIFTSYAGGMLFGTQTTMNSYIPILIMMLFIGIMMVFTRNEQRYVCASFLIVFSGLMLINSLTAIDTTFYGIIDIIMAVMSLYCVLCIGLERPGFPGYAVLTADEDDESKDGSPVHFKVSGAILGYMLMTVPAMEFIANALNPSFITIADCYQTEVICGLTMIVLGIVMLTAGRMRFTPFLFMMIGTVSAVSPFLGDIMWVSTVFVIVLAILCLFRSDRRLLLGIALLALSFVYVLECSVPDMIWVKTALNIIAVAILVYMSFALCSDGRLKVF